MTLGTSILTPYSTVLVDISDPSGSWPMDIEIDHTEGPSVATLATSSSTASLTSPDGVDSYAKTRADLSSSITVRDIKTISSQTSAAASGQKKSFVSNFRGGNKSKVPGVTGLR